MTEQKFDELEERSLPAEKRDLLLRMEAQSRIYSVIEQMKEEGKALTLSDEEIRMLESFRRFKLRMRKDGEVFTWQTVRPEGIQVVQETAEILHPSENP